MTARPQPLTAPRPVDAIAEIADFIGDPVAPAVFPSTRVRWRDDRAAAALGLNWADDDSWVAHCAVFTPIEGSLPSPLALRYHGHQFRSYNPNLGDGRGFLFAQFRAADGRLLDLGTKGSGQTPYSRFGDGRLTLKGAVRELLATVMLEALGVPTSRTFSIIETGEALQRGDEPSPTRSAVLVRLSHGHIRIGSVQRLAYLGQRLELIRLLSWWVRHYGQDPQADSAMVEDGGPAGLARRVFGQMVAKGAELAAAYGAAGFVHGVLNTDNINLTGESFDYGPWRFAPNWDPDFTAAYFDETGLYAFGKQADAIHWNLAQLGSALTAVAEDEAEAGALVAALNALLGDYPVLYARALEQRLLWRLGVVPRGPTADRALLRAVEQALEESRVGLDAFFFDWAGGRLRPQPCGAYTHPGFAAVAALLALYECARATGPGAHPYWARAKPVDLQIETVEALWAPIADSDDWAPLYAHIEEIEALADAMGPFSTGAH